MENNPDLILRINDDGTFLDYHAGDEENLSIDLKKYIGRSIQELLMEKQINFTLDNLREALEDHKVVTKEFNILKNGSDHDMELRYTASGDSEITAIIRDITDKKKGEKDLRESEERYHNLARVSPVGIFRTDADGLTTYVNPTWSRISGLPAEKATGLGWLTAVHPDDRESLLNDWARSSTEKQKSEADYRFIKQDGSITYVIGQAVPEYDSEGQLIGYIGTTTDITERKKVEAELKRSIEAEHQALDIKRTIQAANLALTESLDLNTVLTRLLDFLGQLVPYTQAKVILVQPDLRLKIATSRGHAEETDEFLDSIIHLDFHENPILRSVFINRLTIAVDDTTTFPNWEKCAGLGHGRSWMGVPLIAGGQVLGLFSLDKDERSFFTREYQNRAESLAAQAAAAIQNAELHERVLKHAEELEIGVAERTIELAKRISEVEALNRSSQELNASLKAALIKAESADRLKSAFLATMSHELRTPLNSIIGFTGILLQKMVGPLSAEQEKQLGMVQGSARHLLELINDVLDISKIEADQVKLANSVFNAGESIQRCVERIRPLAQKKGLELITDLDGANIVIKSDLRRVEQILFNLLNNAVKFTERGYVKVESRVENNMLRTSIIDTGIGIKPEDLQILFVPFQQIDSGITRQYEGTGLGLSICGRLIDLLGGEVSVQSKPGKGSTFTFTLPLNRD
jgi:PAS domain S-box-containing protein